MQRTKHTYMLILTHCIIVDSSTVVCWTSLFVSLGVSGLICCFYSILIKTPELVNSLDPDQTFCRIWSGSALFAYMTLLRVSR